MKLLILEQRPQIMRALYFSLQNSRETFCLEQAKTLADAFRKNLAQKPTAILLAVDFFSRDLQFFVNELHRQNPAVSIIFFSYMNQEKPVIDVQAPKTYHLKDCTLEAVLLTLRLIKRDA